MRCNHCERIIDKEESFYEIDGEFYCEDCVEERTITYYTIGGDTGINYEDDETSWHRNINDFKETLKERIERYEKWKKQSENSNDPYKRNDFKYYSRLLEEAQKLLEKSQEEVEDEI
jgi:hypothetical protein